MPGSIPAEIAIWVCQEVNRKFKNTLVRSRFYAQCKPGQNKAF